MGVIKRIQEFFKYWYTRYLLATEMYMVEPWEKAVVYGLFAFVFGVMWVFNHILVVYAISQLTGSSSNWEDVL